MKITRKGYYTIEGPDGNLLLNDAGTTRQATTRDDCYEYITEDGRSGIFRVYSPDREVEVADIRVIPPLSGDYTPDQFTFVDQTDVAISSTVTSAPITITGVSSGTVISVSLDTGLWSKDGVNFASGPGSATLGDQIYLRHTSSGSGTTQTSQTLTIGTVSDTFTSTTIAAGNAVDLGINVSVFTPWGEDQPLANVFHTGRSVSGAIAVDSLGWPTEDFSIYIYEGSTPGGGSLGQAGSAQFGTHTGSFTGQATVTASSGTVSQSYNSGTNTTTFSFPMSSPQTVSVSFANTQRTAVSGTNTGITDVEIMRPGTTSGDFLNPLFTQGMQSFSHFRVGPNWDAFDVTYNTGVPVWANRAKPSGLFRADGGEAEGCAWETVIKIANALNIDCWICLPPNSDTTYLTNLFNLFLYGSNGIDPYTSTQVSPEWEPLNSNLAVYLEIGNEIWNPGLPYGAIKTQFETDASASFSGGNPHNYGYAGEFDVSIGRNHMLGRLTKEMSETCRNVVGDSNMMTRFRPVLAGQISWGFQGLNALSYIMCVHGGHDWLTAYSGDPIQADFPGRFNNTVPLRTPEDGVTVNEFGNVAHPITHWIYGYSLAPYVTQTGLAQNQSFLQQEIFDVAVNGTGLVAMCYEGGIQQANIETDYTVEWQYQVLYDLFDWWLNTKGGGPFANFNLAGGSEKWGQYPDHTRQDPATYPKIRACRQIAGLDPVT